METPPLSVWTLKLGAIVSPECLVSSFSTHIESMRRLIAVLTSSLFTSGTALVSEVTKDLMGALSQTFRMMGMIVSGEWVEMPLMVNRKLGQGGRNGRTRKVIAVDDQTRRWSRSWVWSSFRLYMRNTEGERLALTASSLGRGAETSTFRDLVISEAAVKMRSLMSSWASGSCPLLPKGWASSLHPWCCSHSTAWSMLMCSKMAIGWASWTVGSGPVVYLSRALRGASLLPGMLVLLAAASSLLLVERWSKIGGRGGGRLCGAGVPVSGAAWARRGGVGG